MTNQTPSVSDLSRAMYPGMWAAGKSMDMDYALVVVAIGLFGNSLSAVVMLRKSMRKMTTTVYLLALAISDLIVNMFLLGRRLERQNLTIMTLWYCKLKMFFFYFSIHCSVAYIASMTIEKFVVIWFPLRTLQWCTRKRAIIIVITVTVFMLLIDGHNLFLRGMNYNELDNRTECTSRKNVLLDPTSGYFLQKVYPWIDAVIYCYIPLTLLFVLNILIVHRYRQQSWVTAQRNSSLAARRALQLTGTSLLISLTFMICTLPIATLMITEQLWTFDDDPLKLAIWNLVRKIANSLMYTNHAVNFYIYCLSAKNFRDELAIMFRLKTLKKTLRPRAGTQSSTTGSSWKTDSRLRTASTRLDSDLAPIQETNEPSPDKPSDVGPETQAESNKSQIVRKDSLTTVAEVNEDAEETIGESNGAYASDSDVNAYTGVRL